MAKFRIVAKREAVSAPVISQAISKTGCQFYIIEASVGEWGKELTVEIIGDEEAIDEAVESLKRSGARVKRFEDKVTFDFDTCVHCGACVTLCPWGAIEIAEDWSIKHLPDKCISGCSLCMKQCPVGAIHTREIEEE